MNRTHESRGLLTVIVLCTGGLIVALTQTMVVPIQGELPRLLNTSPANAGWVITTSLLTAAVTMPIAGRLGDIFGKQRVLVVTTFLLIVGSLVCALSSSILPMLAGRALQGMAMGFLPVAIALMREVTPPSLTPAAVASMSATLGVGSAIGMPLSAWVAEAFNWHALFWMSAILAALICLGVTFLVPHVRDAVGGSLDYAGAVLLTVGLVSVLVGVSKGHEWGWGSARTVGCIVGGLVILLVWGFQQLRIREPLVDLRVSATRPVLMTNLGAVAVGFGMMAQGVVMPQLLQLPAETGHGLDQSLLQAGLWLAPGGLMMMLFAPASAMLIKNVGPKLTLMIGAAVLAGGYVVATTLMEAPWEIGLASCVASAGVAIGYAAMPTLILGSVPVEEAGSAIGVNSLMRSLGMTVSAAVMATVLSSNLNELGVPTKEAFEICFVIGMAAAIAAVVIVAFVPRGTGLVARDEDAPEHETTGVAG